MISEKTHIGMLGRDRLDPVELASPDGGLEDVAREGADPLLVRVHDARCEALVDERAHARVRGRVGVDHRAARRELLRRQILERGAAELRREGLPLLGDPHDVLVARDHPEARPLVLGLPVERCIAAEQGEPVVGDALAPTRRGRSGRRRRARARRARGPGPSAPRTAVAATASPERALAVRRRRRSEADEERPAVLARLVDRQRLERGRCHHVAGADVELRPVARADHHLAVELAPLRASTPRACTCRRTRASRSPVRARQTAVPPTSTRRSVPSGSSPAAPTSCQATWLTSPPRGARPTPGGRPPRSSGGSRPRAAARSGRRASCARGRPLRVR